jgi:hypothetical protein
VAAAPAVGTTDELQMNEPDRHRIAVTFSGNVAAPTVNTDGELNELNLADAAFGYISGGVATPTVGTDNYRQDYR